MRPDSRPLDALDNAIIAELRADGRVPNKALAERYNVSEATISARIHALADSNVVRVIAQRDVRALGYDFMGFANIFVAGRPLLDVAREIAKIEEVASLSRVMGDPPLIAQVNGRDRHHFLHVIENQISTIAGITHVSTHLTLEIVRFNIDLGTLESE
jgi:DNA-binding Lrp family transcriptional regulator